MSHIAAPWLSCTPGGGQGSEVQMSEEAERRGCFSGLPPSTPPALFAPPCCGDAGGAPPEGPDDEPPSRGAGPAEGAEPPGPGSWSSSSLGS
eukprot:1529064-Rhodomonas_salina.1